MKDEQFDKELASLYQQRKSTITAPKIKLADFVEPSNKNKTSLVKITSIFTLGGIVSFGILAIVTHFSKTPVENVISYTTAHTVDIVEVIAPTKNDDLIVITPELPKKPTSVPLAQVKSINKPETETTQVTSITSPDITINQTVTIPQLTEPTLLIAPVYKEMPKYPQKALYEKQSGIIKLSYSINVAGKIENITIEKSDLEKDFQRSSIKALANWQYKPGDNFNERYEIIFEFKASNE